MGVIAARRKRKRMKNIRRRVFIAACLAAAAALAAARHAGGSLPGWIDLKGMLYQAGGSSSIEDIELPAKTLYALQLGVFDQEKRAKDESTRLTSKGILNMIWQKERMQIISSVAFRKDELDLNSTADQEAYIVKEVLPSVNLSIESGAQEIEQVKDLLLWPDKTLTDLLGEEQTLQSILLHTRTLAQREADHYPENALYTQLANSMLEWCDIMDKILVKHSISSARKYAAVTMCALCRELRIALIS